VGPCLYVFVGPVWFPIPTSSRRRSRRPRSALLQALSLGNGSLCLRGMCRPLVDRRSGLEWLRSPNISTTRSTDRVQNRVTVPGRRCEVCVYLTCDTIQSRVYRERPCRPPPSFVSVPACSVQYSEKRDPKGITYRAVSQSLRLTGLRCVPPALASRGHVFIIRVLRHQRPLRARLPVFPSHCSTLPAFLVPSFFRPFGPVPCPSVQPGSDIVPFPRQLAPAIILPENMLWQLRDQSRG